MSESTQTGTPPSARTTSSPQPMRNAKKRKHEPLTTTSFPSPSSSSCEFDVSMADISNVTAVATRREIETRGNERAVIQRQREEKSEERPTKTMRTQEISTISSASSSSFSLRRSHDSATSEILSELSRCANIGVQDHEMAVDLRVEAELGDRRWCHQAAVSQVSVLQTVATSNTCGPLSCLYRDTIICVTQFLTLRQLATTMRLNRLWNHTIITQPTRRMHFSIDCDNLPRLCRSPALSRHISSIELIEVKTTIYVPDSPEWYEVEQQAWETGVGRPIPMDEALNLLNVYLPHLDELRISLEVDHDLSVRHFVLPSRLRVLEASFRRPRQYNYFQDSMWNHITALINSIAASSTLINSLSSLTIHNDTLKTPPDFLLEPLTRLTHLSSLRFFSHEEYGRSTDWNSAHMRSIHCMYALRHLRLNVVPFPFRSEGWSSHLMLLIDPERIVSTWWSPNESDAPIQMEANRNENHSSRPQRTLALETIEDVEKFALSTILTDHVYSHLPQLTQLRPKSIEMSSIDALLNMKNLTDVRLHFTLERYAHNREPLITLGRMIQLRRLDLHHPLLSDSDLTSMLASLTQLESLRLSGRCQLRTLNAFSSPRVLPNASLCLRELELNGIWQLPANSLINLYGLQQLRRVCIIECFFAREYGCARKLFNPFRSHQVDPQISSYHSSSSSLYFAHAFPYLTSAQLEYELPQPDNPWCEDYDDYIQMDAPTPPPCEIDFNEMDNLSLYEFGAKVFLEEVQAYEMNHQVKVNLSIKRAEVVNNPISNLYRDTIICVTQFLNLNELATSMRLNRLWHRAVTTQPTQRMYFSLNCNDVPQLCRSPKLSRHISSIKLIEPANVTRVPGRNRQPQWWEVEQGAWESSLGPEGISTRLDAALALLSVHLPHLHRLMILMSLHRTDSVRQFVFPPRLREFEVTLRASNPYEYDTNRSLWPHVTSLIDNISFSGISSLLESVIFRFDDWLASQTSPPASLLEPLTKLTHLTELKFHNESSYSSIKWSAVHMRSIHRMSALRRLRISLEDYSRTNSGYSQHLMLLIDPEQIIQLEPVDTIFDPSIAPIRNANAPPPRLLTLEHLDDIGVFSLTDSLMNHVYSHLPALTQLRPTSVEMKSIEGLIQLKHLTDIKLHFHEEHHAKDREPLVTLTRLHQLSRLDLCHPLLSDSDLTHLLTSLTQLESLTLGGRCQLRTLCAFSSPRVLPHVSQRLHELVLNHLDKLTTNSLIHLFGLQQLRRLAMNQCFSSYEYVHAQKLFNYFRSQSVNSQLHPALSFICGSSPSVFPYLTSARLQSTSQMEGCHDSFGDWENPDIALSEHVTNEPSEDQVQAYRAEVVLQEEREAIESMQMAN